MADLTRLIWSYAQAHLALLGAVAIFSVAAVVSLIVQLAVLRKSFRLVDFADQCFPFRNKAANSLRTDVMMFLGGKLIRGVLGVGEALLGLAIATAVATGLAAMLPHHQAAPAGWGLMVVWSVVLFVVMDFTLYWTHYFEHHVDALWELHKVHHSASALNPMTALRTHPLSDKLRHLTVTVAVGLPAGIAMFLHGFQLPELVALMLNAQLIAGLLGLDVLHHSPFALSFGPLDRIVISPRVHQGHHSARQAHWNHNFGFKLAVWDWMFGTLRLPAEGEALTCGIGRGAAYDARYDSFHGAYIRPVIAAAKIASGRSPGDLPPAEFPVVQEPAALVGPAGVKDLATPANPAGTPIRVADNINLLPSCKSEIRETSPLR